MFIDAQTGNYSNELKTFLLLKLLYRNGKSKLISDEISYLRWELKVSRKTINKHIDFLKSLGWLVYNSKTEYYSIRAFDKLREENNWEVRLAFPINFKTYKELKAVTGAVIYGYLHKDFWRKVKSEKSVQIKESTYYFISPKFNYKQQPAPVSVNGVTDIFNISKATASRLKNYAFKSGFINLKKNYSENFVNKKAMQEWCNYNERNHNIVYVEGGYRLQFIDTVYPLFYFTKRKSL